MEEEEDWDAPEEKNEPAPTSPEKTEVVRTPQKTVRIADGFKYSYEAHASPANIDDWADEPSYNSHNRSNGYNSTPRVFKHDRGSKRFDSTQKNNSSWKTNSTRGSYSTPRGTGRGGYNKRPDWDAPQVSAEDSWNAMNNSTAAADDEDWETPSSNVGHKIPSTPAAVPSYDVTEKTSIDWNTPPPARTTKSPPRESYNKSYKNSTPPYESKQSFNNAVETESWDDEEPVNKTTFQYSMPPIHRPSNEPPPPVAQNDDNWDEVAPAASKPPPPTIPPNNQKDDDEDWDNPGVAVVAPVVIPIFRPNSSNTDSSKNTEKSDNGSESRSYDEGFSKPYDNSSYRRDSSDYKSESRYNRVHDKYADSPHSNKYPRGRNYDSNSRGKFRESYDRRGSDGGNRRGGWDDRRRGGRGGSYNDRGRGGGGSYDRNRGSSRDYRSDRHSPYPKFDRPSRDPAPIDIPNRSIATDEENWDDEPVSTAPKTVDMDANASLPTVPIPIVAQNQIEGEESWD